MHLWACGPGIFVSCSLSIFLKTGLERESVCVCEREKKKKKCWSKYTKRWKTVPVCHTDVTEVPEFAHMQMCPNKSPGTAHWPRGSYCSDAAMLFAHGVWSVWTNSGLFKIRARAFCFKASSHPLHRNPRRHHNIVNVAMATKHILHGPTVNCTFAWFIMVFNCRFCQVKHAHWQ